LRRGLGALFRAGGGPRVWVGRRSCECGGRTGVSGKTSHGCGGVTAVGADVCAACSTRQVYSATHRLRGRPAARWRKFAPQRLLGLGMRTGVVRVGPLVCVVCFHRCPHSLAVLVRRITPLEMHSWTSSLCGAADLDSLQPACSGARGRRWAWQPERNCRACSAHREWMPWTHLLDW